MTKNPKLSFKELQKLWYKKLKASGFEDIEPEGPGATLKTWSSRRYQNYSNNDETTRQTAADYYDMATSFLNDHTFTTGLEKVIWEYHANGLSVRDIADTLKKVGYKKMSKDTVHVIIKRLTKIMRGLYLANFVEKYE